MTYHLCCVALKVFQGGQSRGTPRGVYIPISQVKIDTCYFYTRLPAEALSATTVQREMV